MHEYIRHIDIVKNCFIKLRLSVTQYVFMFIRAYITCDFVFSWCCQDGKWDSEKVISIPAKKVDNWMLPEMPGILVI